MDGQFCIGITALPYPVYYVTSVALFEELHAVRARKCVTGSFIHWPHESAQPRLACVMFHPICLIPLHHTPPTPIPLQHHSWRGVTVSINTQKSLYIVIYNYIWGVLISQFFHILYFRWYRWRYWGTIIKVKKKKVKKILKSFAANNPRPVWLVSYFNQVSLFLYISRRPRPPPRPYQ